MQPPGICHEHAQYEQRNFPLFPHHQSHRMQSHLRRLGPQSQDFRCANRGHTADSHHCDAKLIMRICTPHKRTLSGHVLVMTLVIAGVLGVAIAAYLNVIHTQNNMTVRSQVWNACLPLVEAGIEEALAHINSPGTTNWESNGWSRQGTTNFVKSRPIGSGTFTCTMSTNADPNPIITCTGSLPAPVTVGRGKNAFVAAAGLTAPSVQL